VLAGVDHVTRKQQAKALAARKPPFVERLLHVIASDARCVNSKPLQLLLLDGLLRAVNLGGVSAPWRLLIPVEERNARTPTTGTCVTGTHMDAAHALRDCSQQDREAV
jgi:hypothetical protein